MSDEREPIDWDACWNCDGTGIVLTCIDDICRGAGECMHGDGESLCPYCSGTGKIPIYEEDTDAD